MNSLQNISGNDTTDSEPRDKKIGFILIQITLGLVIVVLNSLVVVSILRYKKLQSVSHIFCGHLAVSDIVFGGLMVLRAFLELSESLNQKAPCLVILVMMVITGGATMSGVFLLWIDSFLMTKRALVNGSFSRRTAFLLITLTWVIWSLYACTFLFSLNDNRVDVKVACLVSNGLINRFHLIGLSVIMFLHLIILITLQCSTFYRLSRHIKRLTRKGIISRDPKVFYIHIKQNKVTPLDKATHIIQNGPTVTPTDPIPGCSYQTGYVNKQHQQDSRFLTVTSNLNQHGVKQSRLEKLKSDQSKDDTEDPNDLKENSVEIQLHPRTYIKYFHWTQRMSRFAKLISLVLFSFIICYTPFFVCLFLYALEPGKYISGQVNFITVSILSFNSFTNVIVYLSKNKDYRKAFKHILTCKKGAVPVY